MMKSDAQIALYDSIITYLVEQNKISVRRIVKENCYTLATSCFEARMSTHQSIRSSGMWRSEAKYTFG